jgi:formylglycine-generating enzyme required for sulfatase activity
MGAQKKDPDEPNHDPQAKGREGPVHEVTLNPFFISKYELTQAQWERFTGNNPSNYGPTWSLMHHKNTAWNPVEQVSWTECDEVLRHLGLTLPTEAQWEYAARGGTSTPWWCGEQEKTISSENAGNLADARSRNAGAPTSWRYEDWEDDWIVHAPVGSFSPNPLGLHHVIGNVWEWCRDGYSRYENSVSGGAGERSAPGARARVYRGGSFASGAASARSAERANAPPESRLFLGLRPARGIH